jgi:hypothetical protein
VSWGDQANGLVRIKQRESFRLNAVAPTDSLRFESTYSGGTAQAPSVTTDCRIDNEVLPFSTAEAEGRTILTFSKRLSGKTEYDVIRSSSREECLFVEPFVHREFTRHVVDLKVIVRNEAAGLHTSLIPIGEQPFTDHLKKNYNKEQFFSTNHLLPGEGFVIVFVQDPPAASA